MYTFPLRSMAAVAGATATVLIITIQWRRRRSLSSSTAHIPLPRELVPECPFELASRWMAEHEAMHGFLESHAVVLATSSPAGGATARTVVLQCFSDKCLVFGSQRSSLKGRDVAADPRAEAVLRLGQRQLRFRGKIRFGSDAESEAAFGRLSRGAQIGLQLLRQGEVCPSEQAHGELEGRWRALADTDNGGRWPRPQDFVAMILEPSCVEAYSGGHAGYVNDRWLWVRAADGRFALETRLQA